MAALEGQVAIVTGACDAKDVETIRACFTADAVLEYPPIGTFGPDGLVEAFTEIAVNSSIVDVHQAHNAEIDLIAPDRATARWNLGFATYDPRGRSFRMMASFYHDEYVLTADGWRIARSHHEPRTIIDGQLAEGPIEAKVLLP